MQFPDFGGVYGRGRRPCPVVCRSPALRQARPSSLPQNLPLELSEDRQQAGHRATGWRGQIQRLRQRHEADAEMFEFL